MKRNFIAGEWVDGTVAAAAAAPPRCAHDDRSGGLGVRPWA